MPLLGYVFSLQSAARGLQWAVCGVQGQRQFRVCSGSLLCDR